MEYCKPITETDFSKIVADQIALKTGIWQSDTMANPFMAATATAITGGDVTEIFRRTSPNKDTFFIVGEKKDGTYTPIEANLSVTGILGGTNVGVRVAPSTILNGELRPGDTIKIHEEYVELGSKPIKISADNKKDYQDKIIEAGWHTYMVSASGQLTETFASLIGGLEHHAKPEEINALYNGKTPIQLINARLPEVLIMGGFCTVAQK